MTVDLNLFNGKSVFITGHTGFKGSWLAFWLTELGAKVTGYALEPYYNDSLFEKLKLDTKVNHIIGDIRDKETLADKLAQAKPEFVFHLAAQALVKKSYADPYLTFSTNSLGSVNILEATRECKSVKSLVYITSDKCYVNKEWTWGYRENDELGGNDPYSASKACAEHIFKSYFMSYFKDRAGFACGSARAGNVIGGGDLSQDRIVPDIIRSCESNNPIILRSPQATRPWQHVLDPLYGYLILALSQYQSPEKFNGESWNFGPSGQSIRTVLELAQELKSIWGQDSIKIDYTKDSTHEANLLHLSIDKARDQLKWNPTFDFNEAIKKTGEWYKTVSEGSDPTTITQQQIRSFTNNLNNKISSDG